ncbi:hypothetical protein GOP47_0008774 [Adiantum capillus-veneris]|uniref:Uncharacterized protein n=1 Tax=Adiantum capillus-veneris TaxID=13818 RepID=A0A9D4UZA4_ADICA|nr:hypothetical protein GOP47_0008774 [Adiantum capillus-veneris]
MALKLFHLKDAIRREWFANHVQEEMTKWESDMPTQVAKMKANIAKGYERMSRKYKNNKLEEEEEKEMDLEHEDNAHSPIKSMESEDEYTSQMEDEEHPQTRSPQNEVIMSPMKNGKGKIQTHIDISSPSGSTYAHDLLMGSNTPRWEFAASLRDAKPKFEAAGVQLIAIGVGTPDKAQILAEKLPFPKENLYADPERKAYDALGLYYGLGRTFFNPASAKVLSRLDTIQKSLKAYTLDATPEDRSSVLQQASLLIFKGTQLLYSRKDEGTGDHASLDDVLSICCSSAVS